jgi:3-hydroxymyristoyl/3-hydroxydecanoyl-(acyl carrier protein) dehydratase
MLSELTIYDGENAEGIALIPDASPFLNNRSLPRSFFVELLSQLIAATHGYGKTGVEAPASGYLVGVQNFDCCEDAHARDSLRICVRTMTRVEGLHIFAGKVIRGEELLGSGEIRCFVVSSSAHPQPSLAVPATLQWNGRTSLCEIISGCMEAVSLNGSAGRAEANVLFAADSPVFAGHFPGKPIVPGVVWIEIALVLATKLLSRQITLRRISSARFKRPVGPCDGVSIELDARAENNNFVVNSWVKMGKTITSSFELFVESP